MNYLTPEEALHKERCRFQNLFGKFSWWQSTMGRVYVVVQLWHDEHGMVEDVDFLEKGMEEPVRVSIEELQVLMSSASKFHSISASEGVSFWPKKG
jgi:hypothetical protein